MCMYRAPSKKRQMLVRSGVYSLMTVLVVLLVTFLVFIMLGYRFNKDTSSIQQGGLVQFASRPIDAKVKIGNAQLGDLTPSKITVNPGNYTVSMSRTGYRDWSKNVDVKAGEVLWLNYTQLVPNDVKTDQLTKFESIAGVKSSPNGDRFAVLRDAAKPEVSFVDVNDNEPKLISLTIPAEFLPKDKTSTYELMDWANDSDRMLVKASYDTGSEYIVVDRRSVERTINISQTYEADIVEPIFDPRTSEKLIIRSSKGDVRTIDTANDSLSSVLASSVTYMDVYNSDAILLTRSQQDGTQSVGYISLGSTKLRELRSLASSEKTLVSIGKYYSEPYLAVSTGAKLDVYKIKSLPSSESDSTISMETIYSSALPSQIEHLSVRSSGRFVMAQYAGGVQTYDIELTKQTLTSFTTPLATELRWLDKYHFYVTNGTNLQVMEFDGGNSHNVTGLISNFDAVQSDDGKYIFTLNAAESGFVLQRSQMILE